MVTGDGVSESTGGDPRAADAAALLLLNLLAAAVAAMVLGFNQVPGPGSLGRTAQAWLLWSGGLAVLVPFVAAVLALVRSHRRRAAWVVGGIGPAILFAGAAVETRTQELLGGSILDVLPAFAAADPAQWAGGPSALVRDGAAILVGSAAAAGAGLALARYLARHLARLRPLNGRTAVTTLVAAYGLGLTGLVNLAGPPRVPSSSAFADELLRRIRPALRLAQPRLSRAQPLDHEARVDRRGLPNVIVIVLESLRSAPDLWPRLAEWGRRGLRLRRHYSGSNLSELGLFCLLYGRWPTAYGATLDAGLPPQACVTLRRSGYRTVYVSSQDTRGWKRMDEFLDEKAFDERRLVLDEAGGWPGRDRRALGEVRRIAEEAGPRPRFVLAYLSATHFPYVYPPEYETRVPVARPQPGSFLRMNAAEHREGLENRYRNAAAFLDDAVAELVTSLDPRRNLVVVTGDHGESLWDDGMLGHAGRPSEAQTRVPCFVVGPGVPAGELDRPTTHADLLPTLLHALAGRPSELARSHGADLLDASAATDHAVLSGFDWEPSLRTLVLVSHDRRLQVRLREAAARLDLAVLGSVDEAGRVDPAALPPVAEAGLWARRLSHDLQRLAR